MFLLAFLSSSLKRHARVKVRLCSKKFPAVMIVRFLFCAFLSIPSTLGQKPNPTSDPIKPVVLRWTAADKVADFWIHEDLEAGLAEAREMGKPVLLNYRCVP